LLLDFRFRLKQLSFQTNIQAARSARECASAQSNTPATTTKPNTDDKKQQTAQQQDKKEANPQGGTPAVQTIINTVRLGSKLPF